MHGVRGSGGKSSGGGKRIIVKDERDIHIDVLELIIYADEEHEKAAFPIRPGLSLIV